jgi:protoheme ferro-lyase
MSSRCVLLLTYGEPPTPAFPSQLKYSWRILLGLTRSVAKIPAAVLPIIAVQRGITRNRMWTEERYASPLEAITLQQVDAVKSALERRDPRTRWDVRAVYEFRDPLMLNFIRGLPQGMPVDIVPMYAACSAFTHDLSRRLIAAASKSLGGREVNVLPPLAEDRLAPLMIRHVKETLAARGVQTGPDWALLLSAHGTLLNPSIPYETGRVATERLCGLIRQGLAGQFGKVCNGWLNHVYGGEWTKPPADEALKCLADEGYKKVVYFPYGFLADNAESELEGRQVLRTRPDVESVHLECLNESPALADLIAWQVAGRLTLRARAT